MFDDVIPFHEEWFVEVTDTPPPALTAEVAYVCDPCGALLAPGAPACHGPAPVRVQACTIVMHGSKVVAAVRLP